MITYGCILDVCCRSSQLYLTLFHCMIFFNNQNHHNIFKKCIPHIHMYVQLIIVIHFYTITMDVPWPTRPTIPVFREDGAIPSENIIHRLLCLSLCVHVTSSTTHGLKIHPSLRQCSTEHFWNSLQENRHKTSNVAYANNTHGPLRHWCLSYQMDVAEFSWDRPLKQL